MERIKVMPFEEKIEKVKENIDFAEQITGEFVRDKIGNRAFAELYTCWKDGQKTIPRETPVDQQYEIYYSNWINTGVENFRYIREHLGEEGLKQYERHFVEALKQKTVNANLILLSVLHLFSPAIAFRIIARAFAYQLQWMTSYKVPELNNHGAVLDIMHCKVLQYPDTKDICQIGCQQIYPKWFEDQYKVKLQFRPYEHGCIGTLTCLNS